MPRQLFRSARGANVSQYPESNSPQHLVSWWRMRCALTYAALVCCAFCGVVNLTATAKWTSLEPTAIPLPAPLYSETNPFMKDYMLDSNGKWWCCPSCRESSVLIVSISDCSFSLRAATWSVSALAISSACSVLLPASRRQRFRPFFLIDNSNFALSLLSALAAVSLAFLCLCSQVNNVLGLVFLGWSVGRLWTRDHVDNLAPNSKETAARAVVSWAGLIRLDKNPCDYLSQPFQRFVSLACLEGVACQLMHCVSD